MLTTSWPGLASKVCELTEWSIYSTSFCAVARLWAGKSGRTVGSRRNNERGIIHGRALRPQRSRTVVLCGLIGIYIGSKTPPEIAVSVMAEVLAVKNGVVLPRDMEVAQAKNERAVLGNDAGELVCGVARSPH